MKFSVDKNVFEILPTLYVGVVAAKGVGNHADDPIIHAMLDHSISEAEAQFLGKKVKEDPAILPYRESFLRLGINPNKYMCSIEALFTRIAKQKGLPHINPLVDLNNAVSLRYTLPMGTHDLGLSDEDIELRFAREGDTFLPFGGDGEEAPEPGELIYAVSSQVRTRRWTWRQSEHGKITRATDYVFFPIDGFTDVNADRVQQAAAFLEEQLQTIFHCRTMRGFVSQDNPDISLDLDAAQ